MAKFKKHTFKNEDRKIEIWVEVNEKGKFFFKLPHQVGVALNHSHKQEYQFDAADLAGYALSDFMSAYRELTTAHSYHIRYRFCFSSRIRSQIADSVQAANQVELKKLGRLGSEYFPDDALSFILDWFPIEKVVHGGRQIEHILYSADDGDIKAAEDNEIYLSYLHKPYDGLILTTQSNRFKFSDNHDHYFEIPLTKDSYEFFISFEANFVKMISMLFQFFNKEPHLVMAAISKAIESGGGFKMLQN